MAAGKFGAFKNLKSPNNDLSDSINKQEALNNAYNEKKEEKAKTKYDKDLKRTKLINDLNTGKKTRFLNYEAALADGMIQARSLYLDAVKRLEANPNDVQAMGVKTNLEGAIGQIKDAKTTATKNYKIIKDGVATKKYSAYHNRNYQSKMEAIDKGAIKFSFNPDGTMNILNLNDADYDDDGVPDVITAETFSSLGSMGVAQADFDLNKYNTKLKEQFGTLEKTERNKRNYFATDKTKGFDDRNFLTAKDKYKEALGSDASNLTKDGESLLFQRGIDPKKIEQKDYDAFLNSMVNELKASYDKTESTEIDYNASLRSQKLKDERDKTETPPEETKSPISLVVSKGNTTSGKYAPGDQDFDFNLREQLTLTLGDRSIEITSLGFNSEGNVVYKGTDIDLEKTNTDVDKSDKKKEGVFNYGTGKTKKQKTTKESSSVRGLDEKEIGLIAVRLGYENGDALREDMRTQIKNNKKNNSKGKFLLSDKSSVI